MSIEFQWYVNHFTLSKMQLPMSTVAAFYNDVILGWGEELHNVFEKNTRNLSIANVTDWTGIRTQHQDNIAVYARSAKVLKTNLCIGCKFTVLTLRHYTWINPALETIQVWKSVLHPFLYGSALSSNNYWPCLASEVLVKAVRKGLAFLMHLLKVNHPSREHTPTWTNPA